MPDVLALQFRSSKRPVVLMLGAMRLAKMYGAAELYFAWLVVHVDAYHLWLVYTHIR